MKPTTHTPGPWIAEPGNDEDFAPGTIIVHSYNDPGSLDTLIVALAGDEPHHAPNAALIAAAPDLKDAVKALLYIVERYLGPCLSGAEMTQARAAIAKAEGR